MGFLFMKINCPLTRRQKRDLSVANYITATETIKRTQFSFRKFKWNIRNNSIRSSSELIGLYYVDRRSREHCGLGRYLTQSQDSEFAGQHDLRMQERKLSKLSLNI